VPTTSLENVRAVDLLREVLGAPDAPSRTGRDVEHTVDLLLAKFQLAGERAIGDITARDLVEGATDGTKSSVVT